MNRVENLTMFYGWTPESSYTNKEIKLIYQGKLYFSEMLLMSTNS